MSLKRMDVSVRKHLLRAKLVNTQVKEIELTEFLNRGITFLW